MHFSVRLTLLEHAVLSLSVRLSVTLVVSHAYATKDIESSIERCF